MTKKELMTKLQAGCAVSDVLPLQRSESGELYYLDYDAWDYEALDRFDEETGILCIVPLDLLQKRSLTQEEIEILEGHLFTKEEVLRIAHCNVEAALYLLETLPRPLDVERLQNPMEEDEERYQETYEQLISRPAHKFGPLEYIRAMLCSMDTFGYVLREERGVQSVIGLNRAVYANGILVQCIVGNQLFEYNPLEAYRAYLKDDAMRLEESVAEAIRPLLTSAVQVIGETEQIAIDLDAEDLTAYVHLTDSRRMPLSEPERRYVDYEETVRATAAVVAAFLEKFYQKYKLTAGSDLQPITCHREDELLLEVSFAGTKVLTETGKYYDEQASYAEMALAILDDFVSKVIPVMEAKGLPGSEISALMQETVSESWIAENDAEAEEV